MTFPNRNGFGSSMIFWNGIRSINGWDQIPDCLMNMVCGERIVCRKLPEASDFLSYSPYIHPSVMFRAEVLRKIKGYPISEETRRCEDYELFMRLHKAGYRGYNLQEPLIRYREDEHTYRKRTIQSRMQEVKIRYRGFRQLGILRPETAAYRDASAGSRAVSANGFKPDPAKYEKGVSCRSTCKDGMSSIGRF